MRRFRHFHDYTIKRFRTRHDSDISADISDDLLITQNIVQYNKKINLRFMCVIMLNVTCYRPAATFT